MIDWNGKTCGPTSEYSTNESNIIYISTSTILWLDFTVEFRNSRAQTQLSKSTRRTMLVVSIKTATKLLVESMADFNLCVSCVHEKWLQNCNFVEWFDNPLLHIFNFVFDDKAVILERIHLWNSLTFWGDYYIWLELSWDEYFRTYDFERISHTAISSFHDERFVRLIRNEYGYKIMIWIERHLMDMNAGGHCIASTMSRRLLNSQTVPSQRPESS